jgi:hypothetical protein
MNLNSIADTIAKKMNFHNSRKDTFRQMIHSLVDQNNVQHHALAHKMESNASQKSKLERIRRFF